jgi:hypothetical protein
MSSPPCVLPPNPSRHWCSVWRAFPNERAILLSIAKVNERSY